jgi:hypothetical protein
VPTALVWVLGATALAGIVATAYLVGRLTSSPASHEGPLPAEPAGELATTAGPQGSLAGPGETPASLAPARLAAAPGAPPASVAGEAPVAGASADSSGSLRREVAQYFSTIDGIDVGKSLTGDPQALAQQILAQALGGDTSALDDLIATQRAVVQKLQGIRPPPPCAEHHRRTLALVEKTMGMTRGLREALGGGNSEALLGLESVGREAERESQELKSLDQQIRRAYGVPASPGA